MSLERLEDLRTRGESLEPGEEALAVYQEILEFEPDDVAAANMVGRSLEQLGLIQEAREHWARMVSVQPDNGIAKKRLADLKHRPQSERRVRGATARQRRDPADIVEPVLRGPGRDGCLVALADAILLTERLDSARLAVTDVPSGDRFRVSGGKASLVVPERGMLCFFLHAPAIDDQVLEALFSAGGVETYPRGGLKSLPDSVEYGVPFADVASVAAHLVRPQREHLIRSIEAGPPPSGHLHDPTLRNYIVEAAHRLRPTSD